MMNTSVAGSQYLVASQIAWGLPARRARAGISLLEVLFAVGVLSVGILAMAALIPLGAYELLEAQKLDQSATLGRAAFRDLEVRGLLQPKLWVDTQVGMLIDPDATNSVGATPSMFNQRIVNYPYLPPFVYQNYIGTSQNYTGPAPNWQLLPLPDMSSDPGLFPLKYDFVYSPGSLMQPIGYNLLIPFASYGGAGQPKTYQNALASPAPFSATEGQVLVIDPLGVAAAGGQFLASTTNGPATIPALGSLPPNARSWSYIQTFPYQQTYESGAPLLPRITTLPEWPQWTAAKYPTTPIPYWPQASPTVNWPATGPSTFQLPAIPGLWPQPWIQSQANTPTIQATPRIMPLVTAERIFRSADDLVFNPQNPQSPASDRPTQAFAYDAATGTKRQEPLYQGGYSWFATVAPAPAEANGSAHELRDSVIFPDPNALRTARQYTVSVVVCQNRNTDMNPLLATDTTPGEWMVPARVNPGSLNGGEVTLFADRTQADVDPNREQDRAAWLGTLRPGQWLMLSGITVSGEIRTDGSNMYFWPRFRTVANWYRIVAVDDGANLNKGTPYPGYRNVTLTGPDWPQGIQQDDTILGTGANQVDFNVLAAAPPSVHLGVQFAALTKVQSNSFWGSPVNIYAFATVVEGVVGVYQKTITLDGDSAFSAQ